jgi:hypothetical protein
VSLALLLPELAGGSPTLPLVGRSL